MFEIFSEKAKAVSSEIYNVKDKTEALLKIKEIVSEEAEKNNLSALWAQGAIFTEKEIKEVCPNIETSITKDKAAKALIGITEVQAAIARTGTLVCESTVVGGRLASMLPLIHIAILREETIVEDMLSALKILHPSKIGYISFITGPSRTADIERVLTIGVHGPQRLIIIVLSKGVA